MEYITKAVPLDERSEARLALVGDVQYGTPACDVAALRRDVAKGLAADAWFIGLGDYIDLFRPTARKAQVTPDVTSVLAEAAMEASCGFRAAVTGTGERWLTLVAGHHYYDFGYGDTSDTRIAAALEAPFGGDSAVLDLDLGGVARYRVHVHHGHGSGGPGSALRHLWKVAQAVEADMYVCGHYHTREITARDRPYFDSGGRLQHRTAVLACSGGYLRGYMQGHEENGVKRGTYVERAMLPPVTLGGLHLTLRVDKHGEVEVRGGL